SEYISGKLRRKGKGKFSIPAVQGTSYFSPENIETMTWGSRSSGLKTTLYNKTREMKAKTDKPYIREAWKVAGFDLRRNTWRLEFSMSGDSHGYECGGMKRKFSDMDFDSLGVKQMVAEMLIQKYFTFAYKRGTGRKRLPLIQATNLVGFEKVRIYETDETRSSRIFAK